MCLGFNSPADADADLFYLISAARCARLLLLYVPTPPLQQSPPPLPHPLFPPKAPSPHSARQFTFAKACPPPHILHLSHNSHPAIVITFRPLGHCHAARPLPLSSRVKAASAACPWPLHGPASPLLDCRRQAPPGHRKLRRQMSRVAPLRAT